MGLRLADSGDAAVRFWGVAAVCAGLLACERAGVEDAPDGAAADADAGAPDSATADAGAPDGATADAGAPDGGSGAPPEDPSERLPGGATTTRVVGLGAYVQPVANLSLGRRAVFENGRAFFETDWVPGATATADRDGLGPTYNATSCVACHVRNGRGLPQADPDDRRPGVLLRIGDGDGAVDPIYGGQVQPLAIAGVPPEARVRRIEQIVEHTLVAGTVERLQRPQYELTTLAHGPLARGMALSPRIANAIAGDGLLDAVPADAIRALEDPEDRDGDGVSGRVAWLTVGGARALGRFGWKAAQPDVRHQCAAAFLGDIGITTGVFPEENCPPTQAACVAAPNGGRPEMNDARLDAVAAYVRLLGVPPRRGVDDAEVGAGRTAFYAVGCAACHRPSFVTAGAWESELDGQTIWPYTDLLLHDMGEGLGDGVTEGAAQGREWRTAPLWGLGLLATVHGAVALLHDGRARSVREAILWHDGEGRGARRRFESLSNAQQAALLRFVESL